MSDDQFNKLAKLVQQGFKEQEKRFETQLGKRFAEQDEKFNDQFTKLYQHVEERTEELRREIGDVRTDLRRVYKAVDQVLKNQETDQQERLVANHQLDRHEEWIARAADTIKVSYDPAA